MKIYLASNYSTHPAMRDRAKELRDLGHEVVAEWISGTHNMDGAYADAKYAELDLRDIDAADAIILFTDSPPGSRSRGGKHVEFGYALAKGKRLFIVGTPANIFHHLPGVIQRVHWVDLLHVLNGLLTAG
jgi:nucleoside 2-deoxyribosyltransferase